MNDETKQLFDAPWHVEPLGEVRNTSGYPVATEGAYSYASTIARLPELYDALMEAAKSYCDSCIRDEYLMGNIPSSNLKIIENGCPFNNVHCEASMWLDVLKKVRDGE